MKPILITLIGAGLIVSQVQAANVAVVDSGTHLEHSLLLNNQWLNLDEVVGNRVDDDGNGLVDDVYGWNFVDQYHRTFFPEHLDYINPVVYPIIRIIANMQAGIVTEDENKFFEENVTKLPDTQKMVLANHLNFYGQYAHGTHVAGIVAQVSPSAKIMSARVFPDEGPPKYDGDHGQAPFRFGEEPKKQNGPVDWIYRLLAYATNGVFSTVGSYLNEKEIDVANYSLGIGLKMIAEASLNLRGNESPTEEEIAKETHRIYAQFEIEGKKWMASAPNTLFVVASGNDGTDNDVFAAFPSNIRVNNAISVAASYGYEKIADFSNYGVTTVDVAAPGVAIMSAVPTPDNASQLPMSGTSMAAPFVTGVAALVKDANPELHPGQMREILMGTVDKKDWLKDKVVSGGVVNPERAKLAAELSREMEVTEAIAKAQLEVADMPEGHFAPRGGLQTKDFQISEELKEAAKTFIF